MPRTEPLRNKILQRLPQADSVALARQELAQARADAARQSESLTTSADRVTADARLRADEAAARAKEMGDTIAAPGRLTVRPIPRVEAAPGYNFARTPRLEETVAKALADAHLSETVAKALADAHISETIAKAITEAQATIRVERTPPSITTIPRPPLAITITPSRPLPPPAAPN